MIAQNQNIALKKLWWVAPLSLDAIVGLDDSFPSFQPGAITIFTTLFLIAAIIVYASVARFSTNAVRTYRLIALIALIVSCIPNIALMFNPSGVPFSGTPFDFGLLLIFHVVAWAVFVPLITRLTTDQ